MNFAFAAPASIVPTGNGSPARLNYTPVRRPQHTHHHSVPSVRSARQFTMMTTDDSPTTTTTTIADDETTSSAAPSTGAKGILMLCLGNICRSPAAEAIMNKVLIDRGLSDKFYVDSCGTGGGSPDWYKDDGYSYHVGSYPDVRMQYAAEKRGYNLTSRSRPLCKDDFTTFHYIVAMDDSNVDAINVAKQAWGVEEEEENTNGKVMLMNDFSSDAEMKGKAVPDPYYSGQDGFDKALDLILDSCNGLADFVVAQ